MKLSILSSIDEVAESQWQALLSNNSCPFIQHAFLAALEKSESAHARSGWVPFHLRLSKNDKVHALLPMYLKSHSWGEYVFDWAWAEAYERYNTNYYPKLVIAIPFTPVPTNKLLGDKLSLVDTFSYITGLCLQADISSWHFLFCSNVALNESVLSAKNIYSRFSVQFHWHNKNYLSFKHFLSFFTSRKRKQVTKERRLIKEQKLSIRHVKGDEVSPQELAYFYQVYQHTYFMRNHQPHLTFSFFQDICRSQGQKMLFVFASKKGRDVASSLFFLDNNNLYGRYWGYSEYYDYLHFELCYYQGIEYCIENGLKHFNPGTQGEHKLARGFEPVILKSYHWIKESSFRAAISKFCEQEKVDMLSYAKRCKAHLPFKQQN